MIRLALCAAMAIVSLAGPAPAEEETAEERAWWVPAAVQIQHAGNIGWIAAGPAWAWWDRRVHFALLLGHVPAFAGGPLTGVAGKLSVWPFEIDIGREFYVRPLELGGLLHYTFGDEFFLTLPDRYPERYYDYSTALRVAVLAGASIGSTRNVLFFDRSEFYLEIGSTDLELFQYLDNTDSRPLFDAAHLAAGVILFF